MAEFEAGNLYDMNKELVKKHEKHLRGKALYNRINQEVVPYLQEKIKEDKYFMLLCHEKRDYTIFNLVFTKTENEHIKDFVSTLIECFKNRGAVYGIDRTEDQMALEIWILDNDDNNMYCYYLFPNSLAVVEL